MTIFAQKIAFFGAKKVVLVTCCAFCAVVLRGSAGSVNLFFAWSDGRCGDLTL